MILDSKTVNKNKVEGVIKMEKFNITATSKRALARLVKAEIEKGNTELAIMYRCPDFYKKGEFFVSLDKQIGDMEGNNVRYNYFSAKDIKGNVTLAKIESQIFDGGR